MHMYAIHPNTAETRVRNTNSTGPEFILCEHPVSEPVLVTKRQKKMAHARINGSNSKRGGRVLNQGDSCWSTRNLESIGVVTRGA
eukprot:scaffold28446_cov82-Cyclotella_meneghiniana.AAC.3